MPSLAYLLAAEGSSPRDGAAATQGRRRPTMAAVQCQQIMKRNVHAVAELHDAFTAARMMRDHDIGFLPVCDAGGRVVGVLTDRDLAIRLCAEDGHAATTTVAALMTRAAVTCRPTHSIAHVQRLMRKHRLTRILVTDGSGRPRIAKTSPRRTVRETGARRPNASDDCRTQVRTGTTVRIDLQTWMEH